MQALSVLHTIAPLVDEGLSLLLGVAIFLCLVLVCTQVKRWGCDIKMSLLDNLRHKAIEQCHDKCVDVRTIDVGVGHDDYLVITQFFDVCLLITLTFNAEAHSDTLDDVHHRLALEYLVPHHLFHVEDLSSQRQDGLCVAVATLFCRTTGGVSLDEEYLALLRVLV